MGSKGEGLAVVQQQQQVQMVQGRPNLPLSKGEGEAGKVLLRWKRKAGRHRRMGKRGRQERVRKMNSQLVDVGKHALVAAQLLVVPKDQQQGAARRVGEGEAGRGLQVRRWRQGKGRRVERGRREIRWRRMCEGGRITHV
jgi:hypothetical protein